MDNNQSVIALIFDNSYLIYDVTVPIGAIYTIMNKNRDALFLYGGMKRLCMHVEETANALRIDDSQLIYLTIPMTLQTKFITQELASKWYSEMLSYKPDRIYVFRDNGHTNETSLLCNAANTNNIPIVQIDSYGHEDHISNNTPSNVDVYYHSKSGRRF